MAAGVVPGCCFLFGFDPVDGEGKVAFAFVADEQADFLDLSPRSRAGMIFMKDGGREA